jgi:hypothetical protein
VVGPTDSTRGLDGEVVIFQRHPMDTPPSHAIHAVSVRAGTAST